MSDLDDECPATPAGAAVDERGCALLSGVIEGLNFKSGSDELTVESTAILAEVAATLRRFPSQRFRISAHTDAQGAAGFNLELSRRRARTVALWLVDSGIEAGRFDARAYGETRPIAPNDTPQGRLANRRVELVVIR